MIKSLLAVAAAARSWVPFGGTMRNNYGLTTGYLDLKTSIRGRDDFSTIRGRSWIFQWEDDEYARIFTEIRRVRGVEGLKYVLGTGDNFNQDYCYLGRNYQAEVFPTVALEDANLWYGTFYDNQVTNSGIFNTVTSSNPRDGLRGRLNLIIFKDEDFVTPFTQGIACGQYTWFPATRVRPVLDRIRAFTALTW